MEVRSSGTTGSPKLIPFGRAMLSRAAATGAPSRGLDLTPEVLVLPIGGIGGRGIWSALFPAAVQSR